MPFPLPGGLPDPGIEPVSLGSPALARGFFTTGATWEAVREAEMESNHSVKWEKGRKRRFRATV